MGYSFGVMLEPLMEEFHVGAGSVSFVGKFIETEGNISFHISYHTIQYILPFLMIYDNPSHQGVFWTVSSCSLLPSRLDWSTSERCWPQLTLQTFSRFGTRVTCITGAIVSSISIFLSSYSTSLSVLLISYGVFGGEQKMFQRLTSSIIWS